MIPLYLNEPYRFHTGGHFLTDETWTHSDRTSSDYELIVGVSGVAFLEADGRMYEVKAGDILFLLPGERHRGYRISSPGVSFFWFHFLMPNAPEGERRNVGFPGMRNARIRAAFIFWRGNCFMRRMAVTGSRGRGTIF